MDENKRGCVSVFLGKQRVCQEKVLDASVTVGQSGLPEIKHEPTVQKAALEPVGHCPGHSQQKFI